MSIRDGKVLNRSQIEAQIAKLCKPVGSLGLIEEFAVRLCEIQGTFKPVTRPRSVTIFAADHGVTEEGVSAWPSHVTRSVVQMMQSSRTASGAFADVLDCEYEVVDIGLTTPLANYDAVTLDCSKRRETGNLRVQTALSDDDFEHAWHVGTERATAAVKAGSRMLIGGEMGIGNTTAATCLIALLCEVSEHYLLDSIVGTGAGIDGARLAQKRKVVQDAVGRVRRHGSLTPRQIGCHVGGLEIVGLAGFYAAGAQMGVTVLIDGMISTSAALLAEVVQPGCVQQMIAGHLSTEPAHKIALKQLGLEPLLDLQMRLGEGTGALAAVPMLDLAAAMMNKMALISDLQQ